MYRDERIALETELEALRDGLEESAAAQAEFDARLAFERRSVLRVRAWQWLVPLGFLMGLVGLAAHVRVRAVERVHAAMAELDRDQEEYRSRVHGDRQLEAAAARRELREKVQARVDRDRQRRGLPPASDAAALASFAELRHRPLETPEDAWVIVGGAACAMGDDSLKRKAEAALGVEDRDALASLCEPRGAP